MATKFFRTQSFIQNLIVKITECSENCHVRERLIPSIHAGTDERDDFLKILCSVEWCNFSKLYYTGAFCTNIFI